MSASHPQDPGVVVGALLGILLDAHPAHLSVSELVGLLAPDEGGETGRDETLVAVGDLVSHGLAHRHGNFVFATVAATRFNELDGPSITRT